MFYIKLDEDMNLVTTVYEPIYRGDNLNQKITYLIPTSVGDMDILTSVIYLNIIRADGEPDVVILERTDEMYKEIYYQYVLPVTCKLSKYAGEVLTWLQIYSGTPSDPTVAKSGEHVIQILESKDIDDYITDWRSDKVLTALYQMKVQTDAEISAANESIEQNAEGIAANAEAISQNAEAISANATSIVELRILVAEKADSLVYNEEDSTIQLTADGTPIGAKIYIGSIGGRLISSVSLTTDGELVIFFDDGTYTNVGKVVGSDGKVYVPHVDAHKIITFTIEDEAGEIPDPVDLNPNDEWSGIDDSEVTSDYVWEGI